ncbi:MAG: hypothetical protein ACM30H_00995, partial [Clostridia bacterium]
MPDEPTRRRIWLGRTPTLAERGCKLIAARPELSHWTVAKAASDIADPCAPQLHLSRARALKYGMHRMLLSLLAISARVMSTLSFENNSHRIRPNKLLRAFILRYK